MTTLFTALFNAEARIAACHLIEGIGDTAYPPEWVEAFCDGWDTGSVSNAVAALPELVQRFPLDGSIPQPADVADAFYFAGRRGFLVLGEWCVRRYVDDSTFYSGWGAYRFAWFYASTVDAAMTAVINAATVSHEKARAEAPKGEVL